jgi:hypothetical protein
MFRIRLLGAILMVPVLAALVAMAGCGSNEKKTPETSSTSKKGTSKSKTESGSTAPATGKTALKPAGFATIKGKVTYDGTPPPAMDLAPKFEGNKDKDTCLKGPHTDPTWIVGPDKSVKNVVLWLKPPTGKYFEIPPDQQKPAEPIVKIDQPFCAFEPHVAVAFPSYFDGTAQKKTGQKLMVFNDATFAHNTNWTPSNSLLDNGDNVLLEPKHQPREIPLFDKDAAKKRSGLQDLLSLKCNIHQWMTGYVWAFDHPYAAITKDDGTYEIKNVPAGTELHLVGWHEPDDYFLQGGANGEKIGPLKENETKELNFTIKKK